MTLPNFLIVGAAKAGTTTLYEHFRAHPEIFMPRLKEPRFFCYGGSGERIDYPVQSVEEYAALFAEGADRKARGEASVHYLPHPQAAQRIRDLIPEARIIASLRDPVDRAYSTHQMNQRNRNVNNALPFIAALRQEPGLQYTYADKLQRYFDLFPAERIRVILLDDLEARPQRTLAGLYDFLEVDPGFTPDVAKVANPGGAPRNKALHRLLSDRRLTALSRRLLPEWAIAPLKDMRNRNLAKQPLAPAERREALAFFREDILKTQDLLGQDLSRWLKA